jgi:anti-sigma regulatory factor (Ser/Thr protein kinase)
MDVRNPSESCAKSFSHLVLAHESLAPGIRPARRLEHAASAERRHDRVEVVPVERIGDPPQQVNLGQITHLNLPLCRATREESQNNDPTMVSRKDPHPPTTSADTTARTRLQTNIASPAFQSNRIRRRGESGIGMPTKVACAPRLFLRLRAVPSSAATLRTELKGWLERQGVAGGKVFDMTLAASEALTIISNDSPGAVALVVTVEGKLDAEQVTVTIRSYGLCRPEPVEHEETLGHSLMRALIDSVDVQSHADGQTITLYDRLPRSTSSAQID